MSGDWCMGRKAVVLRTMPTSQNRDMGHPAQRWVAYFVCTGDYPWVVVDESRWGNV
jgi:hypothetical protein